MIAIRRKAMHVNSLLSFYQGEHELFSKRERAVLNVFVKVRRASDREVMKALGFTDMNSVRPRITELVNDGILEESGDVVDPVTGKTVRTLRLRVDPRKPQREFAFEVTEGAA